MVIEQVDTVPIYDSVADFFVIMAEAIMTIFGAAWTGGITFIESLGTLTAFGGVWIMLIVLVIVTTVWYVVTYYESW